ncbi:MAG: cell division protein FtsZ [Bacteroidales bacterium]|nr:cell division protein FtsZ [Bacteroidales bacterium]
MEPIEENNILNFEFESRMPSIIKVIGVGGGGSNAVNYMYNLGITNVDFVICNTDIQALAKSPVPIKVQLGQTLTEGLGAGSKPEIGRQAAIESLDQITEVLSNNTKMVFVTAGMGGGTGTGAAPIIAKTAKEMGILTVAIVTLPFEFEGKKRFNQAIEGIREIKDYVDSLLIINNQKLREIYGDLQFSVAFSKADDVLATAAKGIAEIITLPGHVNVDFADVKAVMTDSGVAVMGSGSAEGNDRAINAIKQALDSPLLNNSDIKGAKNILLNITCGDPEVTMDEISQITEYLQNAAGNNSDIIFGVGQNPSIGNKVVVTIIATGFGTNNFIPSEPTKVKHLLNDRIPKQNTQPEKKVHILDTEQQEISFDTSASVVETPTPQQVVEEKKKITYDLNNNETVENLENIPAFIRQKNNIKPNFNLNNNLEPSNLAISKDKNNTLSNNNPYLFDKAD